MFNVFVCSILASINRATSTVAVSTSVQSTTSMSTTTARHTFISPRPTSYKDSDLNPYFKSTTKKTGKYLVFVMEVR